MTNKLKYIVSSALSMSVLMAASQYEVKANNEDKEAQHAKLVQEALQQQSDVSKSESNSAEAATKVMLQQSDENIQEEPEETVPPVEEVEKIIENATVQKGAFLYAPSKTTISVGVLRATSSSYVVKKTKTKGFYEISIGQTKYWVKDSNLIESKVKPSALKKSLVQSINTKASFKIYSSNSMKSNVLVTGDKVQRFKSIAAVKGFYVVDLGSRKGYIPFSHVNQSLKKNQKIEVIAATRLYEKVKGKNSYVGNLKNGAVVRVASSNSKTVTIKNGSRTFTLERQAVIPTSKKESFEKLAKSSYPMNVKAEKTATIYSSDKKDIGTLYKGKTVQLIALQGNYGVINYAGRTGYVKLSQFKHNNMVDPSKNITPARYSYYVRVINQLYPEFTKLEKIGASVEGRPIYALQVGTGKKEILLDAALHAREHMTTNVLMEMVDQYTVSYRDKTKFSTYNTRAVLDKTSIWFVPMMNPDGVTLVQKGIKAMQPKNQKVIKAYNKSSNYKRWKANGRGVDLNRNFDGIWKLQGKTAKSYMNYKGPSAFSEPEAKALKSFVQRHKFKTYYSYHSSGQVIYWYNFQNKKNYARDLGLTKKVSKITGYSIIPPMNNRGSGSSADWFILDQKQPGLTMEIAPYAGHGPVSHKHWNNVWAKNKTIGLFGANEANKR